MKDNLFSGRFERKVKRRRVKSTFRGSNKAKKFFQTIKSRVGEMVFRFGGLIEVGPENRAYLIVAGKMPVNWPEDG